MQEMLKNKDCVKFIQKSNYTKDILIDSHKTIVFCYSLEFNILLYKHSVDFSNFLLKVWFPTYNKIENRVDNLTYI